MAPKSTAFLPIVGANTSADPKTASPGVLALAENGYGKRSTQGGVEIVKRNGASARGSGILGGGSITSAKKLATFRGGLRLLTGTSLYSYNEGIDQWVAAQAGTVPSAIPTIRSVVSNIYEQFDQSCAVVDGYEFYAWRDTRAGSSTTYEARYSVIHRESGIPVVSDVEFGSGSGSMQVWAIAITGACVLCWTDSAGNVRAAKVSTSTPGSISASVTVATNVWPSPAAAPFLADAVVNGSNIYFAFAASNFAAIRFTTFDAATMTAGALVASATTLNNANLAISWMDWDFSDGFAYLAYDNGAGAPRVMKMNPTTWATSATYVSTTAASAMTTTRNITGIVTASAGPTFTVYWETADATYRYKDRIWYATYSGASAASASELIRSFQFASRMFTVSGARHLWLSYESQTTGTGSTAVPALQTSYYLYNVDTDEFLGRYIYGLGGGRPQSQSVAPRVAAISSTVFLLPATRRPRLSGAIAATASTFSGRGVIGLEVDLDASVGRGQQLGDNLLLPGSGRVFDGSVLVENGFYMFPEGIRLTDTGAAGVANGTYQVSAVWEWTDSFGQVHRSAPAPPATITVASRLVTITIPSLKATNRRGDISAARCLYYISKSGGPFYKAAEITNTPTTDDLAGVTNLGDPNTANPILYTNGGVYENIGPPAHTQVHIYRNRAWIIDAEDRQRYLYSKEFDGGTMVEFSDYFEGRVDEGSGSLVAISDLEDRAVLFTDSAIFVVFGDGPDDTGSGDFASPQRLPCEFGCTNPASILRTRHGILFDGPDGRCLLDRGGNVSYVGAPVEEWNDLETSASVVDPSSEQARMLNTTGRTLVYDLALNRWDTWTNQAAADAIYWNGAVHYVTSAGVVYYEVPGQYNDAGAAIVTKVKFGWMSLAGIGGRQRLRKIQAVGEYVGAHTLKMSLGYDLDEVTAPTPKTITPTSNPYRAVLLPARQQCSAWQLTVEDVLTGSGSGGFKLSGLSLEFSGKVGLGPLAASRRLT